MLKYLHLPEIPELISWRIVGKHLGLLVLSSVILIGVHEIYDCVRNAIANREKLPKELEPQHARPRHVPLERRAPEIFISDNTKTTLINRTGLEEPWIVTFENQGFEFQIREHDNLTGRSAGKIVGAQRSQEVGSWGMRPAHGNPNRILLAMSFDDGRNVAITLRRAE